MEDRDPISDCSKDFLHSTTPRGAGPLGVGDIIKALKARQDIGDVGGETMRHSEDSSELATGSPQGRESMRYSEDNSELALGPLQGRETMRDSEDNPELATDTSARRLIQYHEENSELVTISKRADSWLTWFLKRTGLGCVFIVRVAKRCMITFSSADRPLGG